jgi:pseudolysin
MDFRYLFPVAFSAIVLNAHAVIPVNLQNMRFPQLSTQFQLIHTPSPTLHVANTLRVLKQHTDAYQVVHLRLQQEYYGFPVHGGYAIFHGKAQAALFKTSPRMTGRLYRDLEAELGPVDPQFVAKGQLALQKAMAAYADAKLSEEKVQPMVYIDKHHRAHWAYHLSFLASYAQAIPKRPSQMIDALTGKVFHAWDDIKTARVLVKGVGYGGNLQIGEYQFGRDLAFLSVRRDQDSGQCYMENQDVRVVNMQHKYSAVSTAMHFACPSNEAVSTDTYWTGAARNGYDKENGAYSPSNDALYGGQVITDLYRKWYGLTVLSYEGLRKPLLMRVHFGQNYANAYWDGKKMTFGDGNEAYYPLVSIGITAHEVSHGFTEQHSNLEYFGQAGGLNESFSDMAAMAAEYYVQGHTRWLIGAEVLKGAQEGQALRYMDKPSRDGKSIDTADAYHEGLNVHYSSGVFNHFFYLLATRPNWTVRQAFQLMLKANMDYWTPSSNFAEAACGVIHASEDLSFPTDDVVDVLQQVALPSSDCK